MPALKFSVKWPDGSTDSCYSPSTVIKEHFEIGKPYSIQDFTHTAETALNSASARVAEKFGYHCSSAMDQLGQIKRKAATFSQTTDTVVVTGISH